VQGRGKGRRGKEEGVGGSAGSRLYNSYRDLKGGHVPRRFIEETIDRINGIMARHGTAKNYLELGYEDNQESMELVSRISDIADAMEMCRSRRLPEQERALYAFAETVTDEDVALFKRYFLWFRSLSTKDSK
jgi:hypothetical protein